MTVRGGVAGDGRARSALSVPFGTAKPASYEKRFWEVRFKFWSTIFQIFERFSTVSTPVCHAAHPQPRPTACGRSPRPPRPQPTRAAWCQPTPSRCAGVAVGCLVLARFWPLAPRAADTPPEPCLGPLVAPMFFAVPIRPFESFPSVYNDACVTWAPFS